ncbi:MAG: NUDIX domain-containing protein [Nanoarchaeota archaeon]|nr:NUDIX domain-containing protein [Nanoarchaeota archaeon]
MADELIDICDEHGTLTGIRKMKKEAHREGAWHHSIYVWIYNSKGDVLLQKRAMIKDSYPGLWDVSVAGHISVGETPEQGLIREMSEEIGVKTELGEFESIGTRKIRLSVPEKNWHNNEIAHVYLWKFDGDPSILKLQQEEVEQVKFVPLDEFEEAVTNPREYRKYVPHGKYYLDMINILKKKRG